MKKEKGVRVLYVEDDESIRNLVRLMLKPVASTIDMANNGRDGVDMFMEAEYDLVFMDIQMPVMDGLDACREIRAWEEEQSREPTPIVALTAHGFAVDKVRSREAGCNDHITKPIEKKELLDAVERYAGGGDVR